MVDPGQKGGHHIPVDKVTLDWRNPVVAGSEHITKEDVVKRYRTKYHLMIGNETIVYSKTPRTQRYPPHFNSPLQHVSFFGRCYNCKYSAHSQKYCPLRYCKKCNQYGHTESVCKNGS